MIPKPFFSALTILFSALSLSAAKPLPNILWIVSEDNSSHWIGAYGNEQAETPNIDKLAQEGTLFEHAYSNGPVCAIARSTIIAGSYAPTMGTQHMRSEYPVPERYRTNPEILREAGYYAVNRHKMDYNMARDGTKFWDESAPTAHYKNRPDGKPFYAVFNIGKTHESKLFDSAPKESKRLRPEEVDVPPYLPDLPEVRMDIARYHDRVTEMDAEVGEILAELKAEGLAENTIVIYASDHGGVLPRGKRYLEETGVKVPFIIRVPEALKHLSPFEAGERSEELVAFIDITPTFLSLANVKKLDHMPGRALLGEYREEPAEDEIEFLYGDRFDELVLSFRRGLTDGKWKYIRTFTPHNPEAPFSSYQFGQPGWVAYRAAFQAGTLSPITSRIWTAPTSTEALYDLEADPWEINNLASDPQYSERLISFRERLRETMKQTKDTGIIPEPMFAKVSATNDLDSATVADFAQSDSFPHGKIVDLAFLSSEKNPENIATFREGARSEQILERYWSAAGLLTLGEQAAAAKEELTTLLQDSQAVTRITSAEALFRLGETETAKAALASEFSKKYKDITILTLVNTMLRLDLVSEIPEDWADSWVTKNSSASYPERMNNYISERKAQKEKTDSEMKGSQNE